MEGHSCAYKINVRCDEKSFAKRTEHHLAVINDCWVGWKKLEVAIMSGT
jgi:hypothetical protein